MNFIINLDSRKDRWKKIEQQFKNNNLSFERFSAIEPNWVDINLYFSKLKSPFLNYFLQGHSHVSLGAIGVFESQVVLWRKCLELNKPICIFEDDIIFLTKTFEEDLKTILDEIKYNFDMIVFFPNMQISNIKKINKYSLLLENPIFGAYGYCIHPDFIRKTLPSLDYITHPFDIQVKNLYNGKDHKIYLSRKNLISTPIKRTRDSNIIQRRNYHLDNITNMSLIDKKSNISTKPYIFSKYKTKFLPFICFKYNVCKSMTIIYKDEIIFQYEHKFSKSEINSKIIINDIQFKTLFKQEDLDLPQFPRLS